MPERIVVIPAASVIFSILIASGYGQSEQCPLRCQQTATFEVTSIPTPGSGSGDDVTPEQFSDYQKKLCKIYQKMKSCSLACANGEAAWQEIWDTNTQNSNGGSMLEVCGLRPGTSSAADSATFQDTICAQDCQIEMGKQIANVTGVGPPDEQTPTISITGAMERQRTICLAYTGLKNCVLSCSGGAQIWDSLFSGPQMGFENILQSCNADYQTTPTA